MSYPLVSVVMSVFNGGTFLKNSIESVINQSYKDLELIIINDGSTDDSKIIIKEYAKLDSRIIQINQKNIGLTKSLNKGINIARGKYIARQDADDISMPNRFNKQLFWLEKKGYEFCCSRALLMESRKIIPRFSYYFPDKFVALFKNPFIHGTLIMRKDILIQMNGYDEQFIFSQDYKLMVDILKKSVKIKYLIEPLYILGETNNRISSKYLAQQNKYSRKIQYLQLKNIFRK